MPLLLSKRGPSAKRSDRRLKDRPLKGKGWHKWTTPLPDRFLLTLKIRTTLGSRVEKGAAQTKHSASNNLMPGWYNQKGQTLFVS